MPRVVVGRDSRASGAMIAQAASAGLMAVGCRPIDVGVVSTPGVAAALQHLKADGALVATASHNPNPWNGLKALRHDGVAPPPKDAAAIIHRFHHDQFDHLVDDDATAMPSGEIFGKAAAIHVDRVLETVDLASVRQRDQPRLRVVVDSVCGAGGREAALICEALGVELIHLNAEPTGDFPHPPEPTREHLTHLSEAVKAHGADVGFAQDPDADRLAIVDNTGRYIGEEYTLALCVKHRLGSGGVVAANLSTSRMIDDLAESVGGRVVRSAVGEANVAAAMREAGARFGGEGNGGIIDATISQVRDSIVGIAIVIEMLAASPSPLSEIVDAMQSYAIIKDKVPADPAVIEQIGPALRNAFPDAACNDSDGVRLDWSDRWVHVRPSNTEPIVRFIAEARHTHEAQALIHQARKALHV